MLLLVSVFSRSGQYQRNWRTSFIHQLSFTYLGLSSPPLLFSADCKRSNRSDLGVFGGLVSQVICTLSSFNELSSLLYCCKIKLKYIFTLKRYHNIFNYKTKTNQKINGVVPVNCYVWGP